VLVWPEVEDSLIAHLKESMQEFYGDNPKLSPDYGRVIDHKNFLRLVGLLGSGKIVVGGETDADELYIAPRSLLKFGAR
jgi:aldehyde dehydrogenase (NAD+)